MVGIEVVAPDGTSYCYYMMSQVPRIGDKVIMVMDETGNNDIEGIVDEVIWILDNNDESDTDNSEGVRVKLINKTD